ncbi:hypothetical protein PC110_g23040 [Phytophthora cactorum]|uniref:Uncharacterized protein n=1 Tax=Phytophthora cactorum TaxID=29920 RepID=A0A329RB85_9STRA|nr:hypothetical protein PC110_g23040 [Phytophthora cactorum]
MLASLSVSGNISTSGLLNGFLGGNQSYITSVGALTELGINSLASTKYLSIKASEVHNGSAGTSANACWVGCISSSDLCFGTGNTTQMILTAGGRVGIGTTSPSCPLNVPGVASFTFGTGGSTVYRLRTDAGVTESALGPIG